MVRSDVDGEPIVDRWEAARNVPKPTAWERQPTEAPGAGQLLASATTAARSVLVCSSIRGLEAAASGLSAPARQGFADG